MPFAAVNHIVHRYVDEGEREKPAIVFANSLGSDLRIWDETAAHLADEFRLVRYDFRGHGLTEAVKGPYSAGELARDLVGLLDLLGIQQAIVCGISVGGIIAQACALNYSERVRALVLSDTGARIGSVESWQQRIDKVHSDGVESLVEMTMERWFSAGFRERRAADVRGYSIMLRQSSAEGYAGVCTALRDADFRQSMTQIKNPTLVLCGAEDIATPPELGRELAGLIAGAQFSLIENAGHLPCVEQPETVVERMRQFFREVAIG
jgi:3-oxoadipate enol-lactonase